MCRVREVKTGPKNVPYLYTSDGRTIRYPDPIIKVNDSIRLDINTNKIMDSIKFEAGNLCMVTGGRNTGRVGTIMHRERHPGSFDIVHVKVRTQAYFNFLRIFETVKQYLDSCHHLHFNVFSNF